jgi:predicted dehydrogenase
MPPPFNDVWTIPGEEDLLPMWNQQDRSRPWNVMTHYHELQLGDFLSAVLEDREPASDGEAGRRVVELFSAVYQSQRDGRPVEFQLS